MFFMILLDFDCILSINLTMPKSYKFDQKTLQKLDKNCYIDRFAIFQITIIPIYDSKQLSFFFNLSDKFY